MHTYITTSLISGCMCNILLGSTIYFEVSGNECVDLCHDLLEAEVSSGMAYVSPSPEVGSIDTHAFNTINEVSLTMQ